MTENAPSEPTARELNPFQIINRGEDTVNKDDRVTFADFSPKVLPADVPEQKAKSPKAGSAPRPARSKASPPTTEQQKSDSPAQTPASKDAGQSSQSAN